MKQLLPIALLSLLSGCSLANSLDDLKWDRDGGGATDTDTDGDTDTDTDTDIDTDTDSDTDTDTDTDSDSDTGTDTNQLSGDPCSDNPWDCDPVSGSGCDTETGWACDYGEMWGYDGFYCFGSSTEPLGALCELDTSGPFCANTLTCADGVCRDYCCSDDDCSGSETCEPPVPYWEWVTGDDLGLCTYSCVRRVDQDIDVADPDGLTWANAFNAIQEGVDAAAAAVQHTPASSCQVWVKGGTYMIYQGDHGDTVALADGVELYGGFAGTETALDERDWVANETIMQGTEIESTDAYVCHVVTAVDVEGAVVDGFTITGGSADDGGETHGGGIYATGSTLEVRNCRLDGNYAYNWGAGIYAYDGTYQFTSCAFSNNASDNRGGGLYTNAATVDVVNCTFYLNSADSEGGGLYDFMYGNTEVVNSIFWANTPDQIFSNSSSDPVTVDHCTVQGGYSDGTNIYTADPLLSESLHLADTSPCIDTADGDAAPELDGVGNPRYDHPSHTNDGTGTPDYADLGAYEDQGT
jgi:hypothetical protein